MQADEKNQEDGSSTDKLAVKQCKVCGGHLRGSKTEGDCAQEDGTSQNDCAASESDTEFEKKLRNFELRLSEQPPAPASQYCSQPITRDSNTLTTESSKTINDKGLSEKIHENVTSGSFQKPSISTRKLKPNVSTKWLQFVERRAKRVLKFEKTFNADGNQQSGL